jgi:hypothetical protein
MGGPEDFEATPPLDQEAQPPDNHDWSTVRQSLTALRSGKAASVATDHCHYFEKLFWTGMVKRELRSLFLVA